MATEPEEERPLFEDEGGPVKSFLEHLEDLRWVLIKSISTVAVAMLICLIGGNYVVAILKRPLEKAKRAYASDDRVAVIRFGTNRVGTYSLDLDQWDAIHSSTSLVSWRFTTNEVVSLKAIAARLTEPDKSDLISQFLKTNLSPSTVQLLTNYNAVQKAEPFSFTQSLQKLTSGEKPEQPTPLWADGRAALVEDLNRVIETMPVYEAARFSGIKLSYETKNLIGQNLQAADLARFNRRLLLHSYREGLSVNPGQYVAFQLEPRGDGANLVLALHRDESADAEALAKQVTVDLNTLSPAGGFFIAFQVAMYAGIAISSPFLFYFICQFVFPALKWKEKKYIYRGLVFFVPLFLLGAGFCYFVLMPVALAASQLYSNWLGFSATIWQADEYISFVCKFILGMGLGFEMPVIILVLVKIGILNYSILSKGRRYMIIINLVLGALLTTPEVLTQVLMAIPLQLLYEISVWIAWYWERRDKKRAAAAEKLNGLE